MRFRFLYLNEAGEEVEVGGLEELRACVAMGRVDENTLLYDSLTREWAPARAHSAYRLLAEELSNRSKADRSPRKKASSSSDGPESSKPADPLDADDLEMSLEPGGERETLPELTPLDESDMPDPVALFLERQERERRLEHDEMGDVASEHPSFHVVEPADELADRQAEAMGPPPPPPPERERAEPSRPGDEVRRDEPRRREEDAAAQEVTPPRLHISGAPEPIVRRPVGRRRRRAFAVLGVVALFVSVWAIVWSGGGAEAVDGAPAVRDPSPRPPGEVPDVVAAAQGSAFQDMVVAMDSLRRAYGLVGGPEGWLDGHYLATASAYPAVEDYWTRYLAFVSELRTRDTTFFRTGFVKRLREDGIEGPVVSMRLASAIEEFRATEPARDSLYSGMEDLASTSLALHALLLEREDDVEYDPVQPGTVSRDPVVEAFPRDPALRDQIWSLLDRIFADMEVVQGGVPGSRDQLTDAALKEILQSGSRRR